MKRRLLAMLMAFVLIFGLIPMSAFADGTATSGKTTNDGVTYELKDGTLTVSGTGECSNCWKDSFSSAAVKNIVIKSGVTGTGYQAFKGCTALESVVLPDSLALIGAEAFADCTALKSISLGSGLKESGQRAFVNTAYYNNSANWENGVLYLDDCLIAANTELTGAYSVKNGTRIIGNAAFYECENLTAVSIPNSVKFINPNAFSYCSKLTDISIPTTLEDIGLSAFFRSAYYYDQSNWENGILYLGDCMLDTVRDMDTACEVKEGTRLIAAYAADWKSDIPQLILPSTLEIIGDYAFNHCSSLTELSIPSSVKRIGYAAFSECYGITALEIEEGVTGISGNAFHLCSSLTNVFFPATVGSVAKGAFSNCTGITDVYYSGTQAQWNAIVFGSDNEDLTGADIHFTENPYTPDNRFTENGVTYTFTGGRTLIVSGSGVCTDTWKTHFNVSSLEAVDIENGITAIDSGAFKNCSNLSRVTMANSVTLIGASAFESCTSITSIDIPDGVEQIGAIAFNNCTALYKVEIGSGVKTIGTGAFAGCPELYEVKVSKDNQCFASVGLLVYDKSETCLLLVPAGCYTEYIIIGDSTTSIGSDAFNSCSGIADAYIPTSVTSIGLNAFAGCTGLANVYYSGTQAQWKSVSIGSGNENLTKANIHFKEEHTHSYTSVVTDPTCTEQGYTTYTCSCGDSYKANYEEALGHDYINGECSNCAATLTSSFPDIEAGAYYFDAVQWAAETGVTNGSDGGKFDHNSNCTRAQIVTFLWRANGSPKVNAEVSFTDLKEDEFYYDAVKWAVANKITNGIGGGLFDPDGECSRSQIVTFLWRANGKPIVDGTVTFPDVKQGEYYYDAVRWAVANGITNGSDGGLFDTESICTRGQAVTFLYRTYSE